MPDLYPEIEAAMEPVQELHRRHRRLVTMRDSLWDRRPWKWIPTRPAFVRRRVFAWYAERNYAG